MNKPTAYLGIDPGITGAIALIHDDGQIVEDWPGDEVGAADIVRAWSVTYKIRLAAIERVNAMPGQGVSSTFKFGANFGAWKGILAALQIPFRTVRPQEWQKGLVPKCEGKSTSIAVARRLFPNMDLHRKADHNRADALLIADWARRQD